jgi:hypothetical protein
MAFKCQSKLGMKYRRFLSASFFVLSLLMAGASAQELQISGLHVVPHQYSRNIQWRSQPDPSLGARVELFVTNRANQPWVLPSSDFRFDGKNLEELSKEAWSWHSLKTLDGISLAPGAMAVVCWNGKKSEWGSGTQHRCEVGDWRGDFELTHPQVWIDTVCFLRSGEQSRGIYPDQLVVYLRNSQNESCRVIRARQWLPASNGAFQALIPGEWQGDLEHFNESGRVSGRTSNSGQEPVDGIGGFVWRGKELPLTYMALEIEVECGEGRKTIWSYQRVHANEFDISGGWVNSKVQGKNSLDIDLFRKLLRRLHINTAQIEEVGGFTDNPEIYRELPLKRFNRMQDLSRFDSDSLIPQIHAVEFLGEPQYGGGRPVPPQEVYDQLQPYQKSRLPTSVTLSEERTWRYYAGLSDYPHYDAYRVIAPAADAWSKYDRWDGQSIRWGAPLETIGDMTRSLRSLNRPRAIAYWSQGAHHDWGGLFSPRRGSPNAEELRSQAWQGLGNGIASLYWFNLSLKSLCKFPDLIEPITRINREILMLKPILESATAYSYTRLQEEGKNSADLSSLVNREVMLLVVNDLTYGIDPTAKEFRFPVRPIECSFPRVPWLFGKGTGSLQVFRVDADGTHDVTYSFNDTEIKIKDSLHVVGIYIATGSTELRGKLDQESSSLREFERAVEFDPASNPSDLLKLRSYLE